MKKNRQPAKINYFFKDGYIQLWNTISATFYRLGRDISDAWDTVAEGWLDFWGSFLPALGSIFTLEFEWDEIGASILSLGKFAFGVGKLFCILFITTGLCVFFSAAHILILFAFMLLVYALFMIVLLLDTMYRGFKHISSNCPNCQDHFSLPVYICKGCGVEHTKLRPGKYGIWKRTCECGCKLPTTFFNGREKLESHCPTCGMDIKDGGKHVDICIPVVGGTSSGKTCLIHQAIASIEKVADQYNLDFEYSPNGLDDYEDNMTSIKAGYLPEKTNDMRLKYYQFYLTPEKVKLKNLVSLCDVGGEVYADSTSLGEQIGYKYANAFLMVLDPLSIMSFREEIEKTVDISLYGSSPDSVDSIVSMLISTLENMFCISSKDMLKTDVAVAFSKGDIPGLDEKIGEKAVAEFMRENPEINKLDAQNAICERFLMEYDEGNFLNSLKSKFRTIQFFTSSSLGHNMDGTPFQAQGVEDPVLWLIDKISVSVDLKDKWGKKL